MISVASFFQKFAAGAALPPEAIRLFGGAEFQN
jgi:hypothetical protein